MKSACGEGHVGKFDGAGRKNPSEVKGMAQEKNHHNAIGVAKERGLRVGGGGTKIKDGGVGGGGGGGGGGTVWHKKKEKVKSQSGQVDRRQGGYPVGGGGHDLRRPNLKKVM